MAAPSSIFSEWAPRYRERGFWPRPVALKSKACRIPDWTTPDPKLSEAVRESWMRLNAGIGLLMGSPFPDGTRLGALDVDRDEYVRLAAALLRDPPSGRIGRKGAVFFVQVRGEVGNPKFKRKTREGLTIIAECLFHDTLCVIPPTIHPETSNAYRWIGTPLLETDYRNLPIVGE